MLQLFLCNLDIAEFCHHNKKFEDIAECGQHPQKITVVDVAPLKRFPADFNPKVYATVSHVCQY